MGNPRDLKIDARNTIISALKRDKIAQKDTLLASLRLETGFSTKVLEQILDDLVQVREIVIDKNDIKLGPKYVTQGVQQ